ncbi:GATA-type zinc finger protein 1 isoform 2-T2 [Mantella aurantiaca]
MASTRIFRSWRQRFYHPAPHQIKLGATWARNGRNCLQSCNTAGCRRVSPESRGRRGPTFSEGKAEKWCQSQGHTNNLQHSKRRMSCTVQVSERTVLNLMEESVKNIPKFENKDDHAQNGRRMFSNFNRTSVLRNSYRLSQSPSSKAMEILNLINLECNQITKLGPEEERKLLVQSTVQNDCSRRLEINNNILALDRSCLSSISEEQGVETPVDPEWIKTITNREPLCKECHSSTLCKVQNVKSQESSIIDGSLENVRCFQKIPRKQKTPMRSVEKTDPNFQGIEFQMHLCFEKEKYDDYRLIVSSFYSRRRNCRKSTKSRPRIKSTSLSSGSDDDQTQTSSIKRCASCKTQKTPLWRDAEDGTPLCNACGIRYKKYGMRCEQCWNIPKKDGKSCSRYCGCGGMFRPLI